LWGFHKPVKRKPGPGGFRFSLPEDIGEGRKRKGKQRGEKVKKR